MARLSPSQARPIPSFWRKFLSPPPSPLRGLKALALTLLVTGLAALLSLAVFPVTRRTGPFMVFTLAVLVCAWTASFWYPLLCSVLAALFVHYFLASATHHSFVHHRGLLRAALWLSFANGFALLVRRIRKSEKQALEAKEKEIEIRSVLDRLTTAHRAAQVGAWDWDLRTNNLVWSEEIYRIHGLVPGHFDGRMETWCKTVHPEDLPAVLVRMQRALETKEESHAEFRVIWPNGEIHWFCGRGQVLVDERGIPVRMVGIGADITERRREEEALRRSEKLSAAGRLAATLAHEINNPLQGLTNLVYLMRQDGSMRRETQALLSMADELLVRVRRIARQTLGIYSESGTPEAIDVVQALEDLLTIFEPRLAAKQLRIQREYTSVGAISAFRGELTQAFSNLLTNAIDASSPGGTLIVRVKQAAALDANKTELVRIELEDFGTGIRPEDEVRIFEPFFTTKSDGTGLGLWSSSQIVEKHGGTIEFRTSCADGRRGTCFSLAFPAKAKAARAA